MTENNLQNFAENDLIIEDVKQTISRYFWKNYGLITVLLIIIMLLLVGLAFFYATRASGPGIEIIQTVSYLLLFIISIFVGFLRNLKEKFYKTYFSQFAQMNGLKFIPAGIPPDEGAIFNNPNYRIIITNEVSGKFDKFPFRLFMLKAVEIVRGRHENRQIHKFELTVFEVNLHSSFPDIFVVPSLNNFLSGNIYSKKLTKIKPDKAHTDFFEIYTRSGYEIEAYQIFTPNFLDFLIQHSDQNLFLNFVNDKLYIFKKGMVSKRIDLLNMHLVALEIIKIIGNLSMRLKDDFEVLHPYYKKR